MPLEADDGDDIAHLHGCPGCDECGHLLEFYAAGACGRFGHKSVMIYDPNTDNYHCGGNCGQAS